MKAVGTLEFVTNLLLVWIAQGPPNLQLAPEVRAVWLGIVPLTCGVCATSKQLESELYCTIIPMTCFDQQNVAQVPLFEFQSLAIHPLLEPEGHHVVKRCT